MRSSESQGSSRVTHTITCGGKSTGVTTRSLTRTVTGRGCFSRIVVYSSTLHTGSGFTHRRALARRRMGRLARGLSISFLVSLRGLRLGTAGAVHCVPS